MTMGGSRAARRKRLEQLLIGLLRTPKTRAGLIAAAESQGATKNFIYGWISDTLRTGTVAKLKSTNPVQYQAAAFVVVEKPADGIFPAWLEPRVLPNAVHRRVFIDGHAVQQL